MKRGNTKMVMVKRIRKSKLDETWLIFTRAKMGNIEYQGPVQKFEKSNRICIFLSCILKRRMLY